MGGGRSGGGPMIGDRAPGGGPTGGGPTGGGPTGGGPTGGGPTGGGPTGGGPTGLATTAASGEPHAWQNELPSGFCVPHRAHVSAIYFFALDAGVTGSARGLRLRRTAPGTALSAMPQLGQKPEATICMWQLGHTVSANPICAASSSSE